MKKKKKASSVYFVRPTQAQLDRVDSNMSVYFQVKRTLKILPIEVHELLPTFDLRRLGMRRV